MNQVLKIAYLRNYLKQDFNPSLNKCISFQYNANEKRFEFYISNINVNINLEINKFIECYKIYIEENS